MRTTRCTGRHRVGDKDREGKSHGFLILSPPVASLHASHKVRLTSMVYSVVYLAASHPFLPQAPWFLPRWALRFLRIPAGCCLGALPCYSLGLELFPPPRHLLLLHLIQASALISFPDHPVSNQPFLSSHTPHLPLSLLCFSSQHLCIYLFTV